MGSEQDVAGAMDALMEISKILNTGLDAETLAVCVELCELGINPEAIATVIKEIRSQTASLQQEESSSKSKWFLIYIAQCIVDCWMNHKLPVVVFISVNASKAVPVYNDTFIQYTKYRYYCMNLLIAIELRYQVPILE